MHGPETTLLSLMFIDRQFKQESLTGGYEYFMEGLADIKI
jgi:hypothetical protein